jgi:hypothetical protein
MGLSRGERVQLTGTTRGGGLKSLKLDLVVYTRDIAAFRFIAGDQIIGITLAVWQCPLASCILVNPLHTLIPGTKAQRMIKTCHLAYPLLLG